MEKVKLISLEGLHQFLLNLQLWLIAHTDTEMSTTSTNPVQNKVVTKAIEELTWSGTYAQMEAALAAGTLKNGTKVFITDDFDEPTIQELDRAEIEALFA